jgi:RNA polymerase sigma-70 factor (ECF subfamily)
MRRLVIAALVVVASSGSAGSAEQPELSVAALPPVVVKTLPQAGDTQVDPSITEIRGTFSKKMTTGKNYSWAGAEDSWVTGKPRWLADGKTCVLPVKLEPGRTYVVWLNSPSFRNFRDSQGQSAIPYLLVFETAKSRKTKE